VYPGTYTEFLWHKQHGHEQPVTDLGHFSDTKKKVAPAARPAQKVVPAAPPAPKGADAHAEKKKIDAEERRRKREEEARRKRIVDLEARIADREREVKALEARMAEPGFYENADAAKASITRHQQLMWEVGDLMNQWEALSTDH
jgi:hypothetical protein